MLSTIFSLKLNSEYVLTTPGMKSAKHYPSIRDCPQQSATIQILLVQNAIMLIISNIAFLKLARLGKFSQDTKAESSW